MIQLKVKKETIWKTVKTSYNIGDTVGLYSTGLQDNILLGTIIDIRFLLKTDEFQYHVTFANAWRDWFLNEELVPIQIEAPTKTGFK
jgi:hypothetical protein